MEMLANQKPDFIKKKKKMVKAHTFDTERQQGVF